jgi:hypothetical protein
VFLIAVDTIAVVEADRRVLMLPLSFVVAVIVVVLISWDTECYLAHLWVSVPSVIVE